MDKVINAINVIGSVVPLTILCMMIVMVKNSKHREKGRLLSYTVVAIIMFILLLRS